MNVYLVARTNVVGYDEHDSFVCIAADEQQAKETHPSGDNNDWLEVNKSYFTWVPKDHPFKVTLIGVATEGSEAGVVLASYHAG